MSAMTKDEVETYLAAVDLRTPLEAALNVAVSRMTMAPQIFFAHYFNEAAAGRAPECVA